MYFHTQKSNLTHLPRSEYVPGIGLGIAKCPYDPQDNSTAVWVESGNPGDLPALVSVNLLHRHHLAHHLDELLKIPTSAESGILEICEKCVKFVEVIGW